MNKKGIFPSRMEDLNTYFRTVVAYLILHGVRLKVSTDDLDELPKALDEWILWYDQWFNKNLRNKTITANKDAAMHYLISFLRRIYGDIPQSLLTAEDRTTLNLEERSTSRTPVPVPHTIPIGKVNFSKRLVHSISFTDEDGKHGKPEGVRGCQIWCKEGEPVLSVKELRFLATDTASPYLHQFDVEDVGKTIHYWLRWENTRGETGLWSAVVSAVVTG